MSYQLNNRGERWAQHTTVHVQRIRKGINRSPAFDSSQSFSRASRVMVGEC
jgi:hypothetical protein